MAHVKVARVSEKIAFNSNSSSKSFSFYNRTVVTVVTKIITRFLK